MSGHRVVSRERCLLRHDIRRPKNRKLACLLQPSSLPSPTSFLPSFISSANSNTGKSGGSVKKKLGQFYSANRTEAGGTYEAVKPSWLDVTHLEKSLGDVISLSPQQLVPLRTGPLSPGVQSHSGELLQRITGSTLFFFLSARKIIPKKC